MGGKKEDDVNVSNLTLRKSKGDGVFGGSGASMHLDNVSVQSNHLSSPIFSVDHNLVLLTYQYLQHKDIYLHFPFLLVEAMQFLEVDTQHPKQLLDQTFL